jgi:ATP-dependent helicase/nuclease subunit A
VSTDWQNPQNPYESFVVTASAGSGKTFQLSRRFIALVCAGADPARILTVTFTRKAAAEMSERILSDAAAILRHPSSAAELASSLATWHQSKASQVQLQPPINLKQAAERIISASGRLQISTIDSLLYSWQCRYPSDCPRLTDQPLTGSGDLISASESQKLYELAWNRCVIKHLTQWLRQPVARRWIEAQGINGLRRYLTELLRYSGLIWSNAQRELPTLIPWREVCRVCHQAMDDTDWFAAVAPHFASLSSALKPEMAGKIEAALQSRRFEELIASKILTKERWTISQTYVRGEKRERFSSEISAIEELVRQRVNAERLGSLDAAAEFLLEAFGQYEAEIKSLKAKRRLIEFSDLLQSGYELVVDPRNLTARMLIQRSFDHLMLDEFQDTSLVQWQIFSELCAETMSGRGLNPQRSELPGTVFIVGDPKQSIYGFRDADPSVLRQAAELVVSLGGHTVELSESYRSTALVLDWVNHTFNQHLPDFPWHRPATTADGQSRVPDQSYLAALFPEDDQASELEERSDQRQFVAQAVAEHIQKLCHGLRPLKIYDKNLGATRPLEPRDCAVLYRAGTATELIEEQLKLRKIPVHREEAADFLHSSDVRDCLALIRLSALRSERLSLAQILRSPFIRMTDQRFLAILQQQAPDLWSALAEHAPAEHRLLQAILEPFEHYQVSAALPLALRTSQYIETIAAEKDAMTAHNSADRLRSLVEVIRSIEQAGSSTAWDILRALDDMAKSAESPQNSPPENAVRMMTIHKSKGLEFPLVCLVGIDESWEKTDLHWTRFQPENRPPVLFFLGNKPDQPYEDSDFSEIQEAMQANLRAESERLLYVAMTRAQCGLVIAGAAPAAIAQASDRPSFFQRMLESLRQCTPKGTDRHPEVTEAPGLFSIRTSNAEGLSQAKASTPAVSYQPLPNPPPIPRAPFGFAVIRPHRLGGGEHNPEESDYASSRSEWTREQRKLVGTFLHHCLQEWLRDRPQAEAAIWQRMSRQFRVEDPESLFVHACSEWQRIREQPLWSNIRATAAALHCELPFIQSIGSSLVRGSMDLVVIGPQHSVTIFDYKYAQHSLEELRLQYRPQLAAYRDAAQKLFPRAPQFHTAIIRLPHCDVIEIDADGE